MKKIFQILFLIFLIPFLLITSGCNNNNDDLEHEHSYSKEWSYDSEYHWHESTCEHDVKSTESLHSFGNWIIDINPSETTEGQKYKICYSCNYIQYETIPKLEHIHTYSSSWTFDNNYHWHESTCEHNIKSNLSYHSFENWVTIINPTETTEGQKYKICYSCNYIQYETIPKLTHTHTYSENWSYNENYHWKDSTCGHNVVQSNGSHNFINGICSICNQGKYCSLTINYYYIDTNTKIYNSYSSKIPFNSTFSIDSPVIDDYTADTLNVSGTMNSLEGLVINVYYTETALLPVKIYSIEDFQNINNNLSKNYILMNDIDFGKTNFTRIGSDSEPFIGTFDGNNFTITTSYMFGIFGSVSGEVKNLKYIFSASGTSVISDTALSNIGCITKTLNSNGKITNCSASFSDVKFVFRGTGAWNDIMIIGGICGSSQGTIENCKSTIELNVELQAIASSVYLGGICGSSTNSAIFRNCYFNGTLIGYSNSKGGVVKSSGICNGGQMEKCFSAGYIQCNSNDSLESTTGVSNKPEAYASGLGGVSANNCFVIGTITSNHMACNLTAFLNEAEDVMTNCYVNTSLTTKKNSWLVIINNIQQTMYNFNGITMDRETMYTEDFLANTLGFDTNIWKILESQLPKLYWEI